MRDVPIGYRSEKGRPEGRPLRSDDLIHAPGASWPASGLAELGQLGRRYDAGCLRRVAKPKCHALVACCLIEARNTLLDQIVEMNDLFLTGMNRRSRTLIPMNGSANRARYPRCPYRGGDTEHGGCALPERQVFYLAP